jgi:hypothetical protein
MTESDLSQLQDWLKDHFRETNLIIGRVELLIEGVEDKLVVLDHAFAGLASRLDERLPEKEPPQ